MKSNIPQLAIPVLAALVLVGCNQKRPSSSTEMPSPTSSMSSTNGTMETASMPAPNGMSHMMPETNGMSRMMPATNGMSHMMSSHMNVPANPNQ